jgi:hypothetical protein
LADSENNGYRFFGPVVTVLSMVFATLNGGSKRAHKTLETTVENDGKNRWVKFGGAPKRKSKNGQISVSYRTWSKKICAATLWQITHGAEAEISAIPSSIFRVIMGHSNREKFAFYSVKIGLKPRGSCRAKSAESCSTPQGSNYFPFASNKT